MAWKGKHIRIIENIIEILFCAEKSSACDIGKSMFILVFWIRKKKIKDNCYWIIPFSPNPGQWKLLYSRMKIQKFPFERVCLAKIFISKIGRKIINKEAKIEEFLRGSSSKTLVSINLKLWLPSKHGRNFFLATIIIVCVSYTRLLRFSCLSLLLRRKRRVSVLMFPRSFKKRKKRTDQLR